MPYLSGLKYADPPGMPPKILSSGLSNIFMGKGNITIMVQPSSCSGHFVVEGEAEVSAIRFSSASLSDPIKLHWRVRRCEKIGLVNLRPERTSGFPKL